MTILFVLFMGLYNALRGSGAIPKVFMYASMAVSIAAYTSFPILLPILFPVIWLCFAPGWSTYMNAAFPNIKYIDETEIRPIDWLTTKILGKPYTATDFATWCTLAMSFRGLMFYPIFTAISYVHPMASVYGFGMALMGPIYWARRILPAQYSIRGAEYTTGCLLATLIALSS